MLIKKRPEVPYSEITRKSDYLDRRKFLKAAGIAGAALATTKFALDATSPTPVLAGSKLDYKKSDLSTHGEPLTPVKDITTYNNFYEFGTDKSDPAHNAGSLRPSPWTVSIEGQCEKPQKLSMDQIMKLAPLEERVYRMRCVEGWSMVIPWIGIPLNTIIQAAKPKSSAKFVAFETLYDPKQMPGQRSNVLNWPYVEGLRL